MSICKRYDTSGLRISKVYPGSIGEEMGFEIGDTIIAINDNLLDDQVEYSFLQADEFLKVDVVTVNGEKCTCEIEKDFDEELGLEFEEDLLDTAKSCTNKCVFCFIDQLPKGMRESLYFKDDDTRLSFLHGSFVTLTNMEQKELDKVIKYRISPINISVHTTNPSLRVEMLKNRFAGDILDKIKYLTENGIRVNCQIVLCRGINDEEELDRTIRELSSLYPAVHSVAVVPSGLTDHREGLVELKNYDKDSSIKVLEQIKKWQNILLDELSTRFVFASDEFYIMAEKNVLDYEEYEDFAQIENGVGLLASFEDEFINELNEQGIESAFKAKYSIATGESAYKFMCGLVEQFKLKYNDIGINVYKVINDFFGHNITVSGLITAQDLIKQLKGKDLGDTLFISRSMLKQDEPIFLDDYTIDEVKKELNVDIVAIENGSELVCELLKNQK